MIENPPRCGRCGGKMLADGLASDELGNNYILYSCHKCVDEVQAEDNASVPVSGPQKGLADWSFGR